MAKSIDQLLRKTDSLILEITKQYEELKEEKQFEGKAIALLASDIDYLSSLVKTLCFFENNKPPLIAQKTSDVSASSICERTNVKENVIDVSSTMEHNVVEENVVNEPEDMVVVQDEIVGLEVKSTDHHIPAPELKNTVEPVVEAPVIDQLPNDEVVVEKERIVVHEESIEEKTAKRLTINELIQQQKQAGVNLTQQFQTSPSQDKVVDLRTAINLNDKLMFIRDLFNGYSLAYSEALELLNRFDNYGEADAFLQTNYALKNGWSSKPQTVEKFYSLLRKKFN